MKTDFDVLYFSIGTVLFAVDADVAEEVYGEFREYTGVPERNLYDFLGCDDEPLIEDYITKLRKVATATGPYIGSA